MRDRLIELLEVIHKEKRHKRRSRASVEGRKGIMLINYIKNKIFEWQWLKSKPCGACKHFAYYMGSAGICTAKSGCPTTRMRDYSDTCDCGCFKKRR